MSTLATAGPPAASSPCPLPCRASHRQLGVLPGTHVSTWGAATTPAIRNLPDAEI